MNKISDMLTRIRNAQMAGRSEVAVPFSNLKMAIAKVMQEKGYIEQFNKETTDKISQIIISLRYERISSNKKNPAITGIRQISKSGRRVYIQNKDIHRTKQGYGISIISTSKGLMTGEDAKNNGVGGEVICEIW